jgi:hypothetical protein
LTQPSQDFRTPKGARPPLTPAELNRVLMILDKQGLADYAWRRYKDAWKICYSRGRGNGTPLKHGHSDPTGDVVAEKELAREHVRRAGKAFKAATVELERAFSELDKVLGRGPYERVRHRPGELNERGREKGYVRLKGRIRDGNQR